MAIQFAGSWFCGAQSKAKKSTQLLICKLPNQTQRTKNIKFNDKHHFVSSIAGLWTLVSDIECALLRPLSFLPGNIIISYSTLSQLNISHMVLKNLLWTPPKSVSTYLFDCFLPRFGLRVKPMKKAGLGSKSFRSWSQGNRINNHPMVHC